MSRLIRVHPYKKRIKCTSKNTGRRVYKTVYCSGFIRKTRRGNKILEACQENITFGNKWTSQELTVSSNFYFYHDFPWTKSWKNYKNGLEIELCLDVIPILKNEILSLPHQSLTRDQKKVVEDAWVLSFSYKEFFSIEAFRFIREKTLDDTILDSKYLFIKQDDELAFLTLEDIIQKIEIHMRKTNSMTPGELTSYLNTCSAIINTRKLVREETIQ